jgi:hypothetical protein
MESFMTGRDELVVALFRDRSDAEAAINDLVNSGFSNADVGVAMRDRSAQGDLIEDTGTKAAAGATTGVLSGGAIGGVVGALIGTGALLIPGIGPVVAGGLLASWFGVAGGTAVAGAGIGAATGGLVGGLIGAGIPEEEARHFERGFNEGGTIVTVATHGRRAEAVEALRRHDADLGPAAMSAARTSSQVDI